MAVTLQSTRDAMPAVPISVQCLIFHATIVKIRCSLTL
jgi:hypothetical protein